MTKLGAKLGAKFAHLARTRGFRAGLVALAGIGALAVPTLTPTPAQAWWVHGGGGWGGGGCCWRGGGGVFIGVAPPPVVVAPPAYYAPPPPVAYYPPPAQTWIPPHWEGNSFIPGHWA